jgi:hypothetical protein
MTRQNGAGGTGKVGAHRYPITKVNGMSNSIAEREDVVRNLIAHVSNSMMNETFGIVKVEQGK